MDLGQIELVVGLALTFAGWELGRRIWEAKGADPHRGRCYGAALCFLFGLLGLLTLIGIELRWHPACEPLADGTAGMPARRPRSIARSGLLGLAAIGAAVALVAVLGFAADALRYDAWSKALPPGDPAMSRAECARVTSDWDACYVPHAEHRTAGDWRDDWDGRRLGSTGAAGLCGLALAASIVLFLRLRRSDREEAPGWHPAPPPSPTSVGPVAPFGPLPPSGGLP
ncbi:MAG: hypothetical protein U0869_21375 [Chloroflexota bacterium]